MNKKTFYFVLLGSIVSSLYAGNLFSNSGFESNSNGWQLSMHDTLQSKAKPLTRDSVGVKFGKKYLKIEITKVDSLKTNWWIQLWEPTWTAKPNVTYTFSCQAKSGDSLTHPFDISATGDDDSTEYTYRGGNQLTATSEWSLCTYSYTWAKAAKIKHFRLFVGGSTGIICLDSMYLDSATAAVATKNPMTISYGNPSPEFTYQLLPDCIRFDMKGRSPMASRVAIYSLEGRLVSSRNVAASSSTFEIPKPTSGAWVVDVNSNKKVLRLP
jgi:hypothetical protein